MHDQSYLSRRVRVNFARGDYPQVRPKARRPELMNGLPSNHGLAAPTAQRQSAAAKSGCAAYIGDANPHHSAVHKIIATVLRILGSDCAQRLPTSARSFAFTMASYSVARAP